MQSRMLTCFLGVEQFFAAANHPCPPLRNPSDHYLQIINADFDTVKSNLKELEADHVSEQMFLSFGVN